MANCWNNFFPSKTFYPNKQYDLLVMFINTALTDGSSIIRRNGVSLIAGKDYLYGYTQDSQAHLSIALIPGYLFTPSDGMSFTQNPSQVGLWGFNFIDKDV